MSVIFGGTGDFLTRSGAYLNIAASFTISGWAAQGATTPTGGAFRIYYNYGGTGSDPYVYLGSPADSNAIVLEVFDGSNYFDTIPFTPTAGDFFYWTIRYDATTHALDFIVDTHADSTTPTIVDTLTINLSSIVFVGTDESIGGSWADFHVGYIAVYQAKFSLLTIQGNRTRSDFNPGGSFYRSFTRLLSAQSLDDTTGNGRDWTLSGTLPYPTPIGTIIYRDDFDDGDKELWANWRAYTQSTLSPGGCTPDGFVYACNAVVIEQEINPSANTLSLRVQMGALVGSAITGLSAWELSVNFDDGLGLFLLLNGDRSFNLRMNNVVSAITSPPDLFPNDGSNFALQWRMSVQTSQSVLVHIDINNVTVWTVLYDWSGFDPSTTTGVFSGITINAFRITNADPTLETQLFFDEVEVDSSDATVSWLPCGVTVFPPCWVPPEPTEFCATIVCPPGYGISDKVIRRERIAPHLSVDQKNVFYPAIQVETRPGIGNVLAPGVLPKVMLSVSFDGGYNWTPETWMSAGELGNYRARVIARQLGYGRDVLFKVIVSDPNTWDLVAAYFDPPPKVGRH